MPLRTSASPYRWIRVDDTWIPICVVSFFRRAYSVSMRVSLIVLHSGFCTYTGLPRFIASIATRQCMWSGIETFTESMFACSLWSSSRQSW